MSLVKNKNVEISWKGLLVTLLEAGSEKDGGRLRRDLAIRGVRMQFIFDGFAVISSRAEITSAQVVRWNELINV